MNMHDAESELEELRKRIERLEQYARDDALPARVALLENRDAAARRLQETALDRAVRAEARVVELEADKARLDWLEAEMEHEQQALALGIAPDPSLFRANRPITRAAIDAARLEE